MRFWWVRNGERAGLLVVVLILAAALALFYPVGRVVPLSGIVTAINVQDARRAPPFNAWVDLGGSKTVVGLPDGHKCVVGSRIALEKARFRFGQHYAAARQACDIAPKIAGDG